VPFLLLRILLCPNLRPGVSGLHSCFDCCIGCLHLGLFWILNHPKIVWRKQFSFSSSLHMPVEGSFCAIVDCCQIILLEGDHHCCWCKERENGMKCCCLCVSLAGQIGSGEFLSECSDVWRICIFASPAHCVF